MSTFCSGNLLTVLFPEARQQFCPWIPYPFARIAPISHGTKAILTMHKKTSTEPAFNPIIRTHRTQWLNYLLSRQRKHLLLVLKQLPMKVGWWDGPLALWDLAEAICLKRRIALRIKLDSMFDNQIQLDWVFSKNQVFKNSSNPFWTQFPCHSCVLDACEHKYNNPSFIITLHIYVNMFPHSFSYNLKSDTLRPVIDFNFNHWVLMLILMGYTHEPSVSSKLFKTRFELSKNRLKFKFENSFKFKLAILIRIYVLNSNWI